jgi:hypothetical protein
MFKEKKEINIHLESIFNNETIKKYKYIIPTFSNIIEKNKNDLFDESFADELKLGWARAIGHEIHYCRNILIYLKNNNLLNENVIILTTPEKSFFYENLFKTEIMTEDNVKLLFDKTLHLYLLTAIDFIMPLINLSKITYCDSKYHNDIKNFNLENLDNKNNFIVIHQRYRNNTNILINIINKVLKKINITIYIFSEKNINFYNHNNIIVFNNLKKYFSLINSTDCKLTITPISGLGEMVNLIGNCNVLIIHDCKSRDIYYNQIIKYNKKNNFLEYLNSDNMFFLIPLINYYYHILDISNINCNSIEDFKSVENKIDDILQETLN